MRDIQRNWLWNLLWNSNVFIPTFDFLQFMHWEYICQEGFVQRSEEYENNSKIFLANNLLIYHLKFRTDQTHFSVKKVGDPRDLSSKLHIHKNKFNKAISKYYYWFWLKAYILWNLKLRIFVFIDYPSIFVMHTLTYLFFAISVFIGNYDT